MTDKSVRSRRRQDGRVVRPSLADPPEATTAHDAAQPIAIPIIPDSEAPTGQQAGLRAPTRRPQPAPVLRAKVQPPPLRTSTLSRQRLLDRLAQATQGRVTLVIADAGYGKTTLMDCISGFLELDGGRIVLRGVDVSEWLDVKRRAFLAHRTQLRQEWARRIGEARLLTALTQEEIFSEATSVYDNYVEVLETGSVEALQDYARNLSERIIPRGVETDEVVGIVLLLRDVLARSLFAKYQHDFSTLNRILDAYEPAANRIANTVAVGYDQEREGIIREKQEAIRELSTPVLQVRERLVILPIIGAIDPHRARQLTEQLLHGIRATRGKVVVIDLTGVAAVDSSIANHLVQTVEASRLPGAPVIVTGLSPAVAQTPVNIGVDLGQMNPVGDLQGGIEQAERLLGYKVVPITQDNPTTTPAPH